MVDVDALEQEMPGLSCYLLSDPQKEAEKKDLQKVIIKALYTLNSRERFIIEKRFGLFDDVPHTYVEIGRLCGVSIGRVRDLYAHAIRKLRHPKNSKRYRSYYSHCERTFRLMHEENEERREEYRLKRIIDTTHWRIGLLRSQIEACKTQLPKDPINWGRMITKTEGEIEGMQQELERALRNQ